ncbi:MAG: hypothetical protein OXL38_01270 [Gammaproteobacteria bacterium]|nr:hypothetical protein [Gammaproteobacteria bacterium]
MALRAGCGPSLILEPGNVVCHPTAMDDPPRQLFMPGTGQLPPYFAGREDEQRTLLDCLDVLRRAAPFLPTSC